MTTSAKQAGKSVVHGAKRAAANPWFERLERFGFLARGLIYMIIGVLALQLAAGAGGATATPTSAIALIRRQPAGKGLLVLMNAGPAGYLLGGLFRALIHPFGRGRKTQGMVDPTRLLVCCVSL